MAQGLYKFIAFSAIGNYSPSPEHPQLLPFNVGETVHILEEYSEGPNGNCFYQNYNTGNFKLGKVGLRHSFLYI